MIILTRYISREVVVTSLAVTTVLLLMVASSRFAYYLSRAVAGELDAQAVITVILNLLPAYISNLLPLGTFIGVLVALARMSVDNEITILFANGVSQKRLLGIVFYPVAALTMLVALLSLVIAPHTSRVVEEVLIIQSHSNEFDSLQPGKFQGNGNRQAIYAESLSEDKSHLYNVFVYSQSANQPAVLIKAEAATQYYDDQYAAKYLLLENGTRTQMQADKQSGSITKFKQMGVRLHNSEMEVEVTQSFTIPTSELLDSPKASYRAQLYWRFSLPLMTLIVCLSAIALSQVKPRQGRFARLLPALVMFLAYLSLLMRFRDQISRGVEGAELNVLLLHGVYVALGVWLMFAADIKRFISATERSAG